MECESDSDDYRDVGEEIVIEENVENRRVGGRVNSAGKKVRGCDVNWMEFRRFANVEEYNQSEVKKDIADNFTLRRRREPDYADTEHFTCKYSRKVGYRPCPLQYKISFLSHCDEVIVEIDGTAEHCHEIDR